MRFALLGADEDALSLAQAAVSSGHQIVWCGEWANLDVGQFDGFPTEDVGDQWEALLDKNACDAVIVGRGVAPSALRTEQIIQLVRQGRAVLTTFPLLDSVLVYYEIDLARNDGNAVLQHFNPLVARQQLVDEACNSVRHGHAELGAIEQIVLQRPLADRTRGHVVWHFARDVELLSAVAGRLDRLGALGSPNEAATYAGLSVQLLGECNVPVRWEVEPVLQSSWPRLVLVAERGKEAILLDDTSPDGDSAANAAAGWAIDRLVRAVESSDSMTSSWPSALRAMELADTIEISLRRGRMIDVHQQQLTEQLAFKGTMSAVGCGVLLVLPPLLVAIGWLAEQIGLPVASYWPHLLLALLALFLVFQLLPKLLFAPESGVDAPRKGPSS